MFEVLDAESEVTEAEDAEDLPPVDGAITFDDVTFAYDETPVLQDIDLDIEQGETIGVVGETGAGKTTLARLIMRFVDPDEGVVSIDGHDLTAVTLDSLRSQVGLVAQDMFFFHTTIRENLSYADPDAEEAALDAATKKAGIHDFIQGLPDGYDTDIGERGAQLSRGERQRLAMARVFLKQPPIVILDEATSSLDPRSEETVQEAIDDMAQDTTMVIIAHTLSSLQHVDRIVVIGEDGGIAETGTQEELIAERGAFWELYQSALQSDG